MCREKLMHLLQLSPIPGSPLRVQGKGNLDGTEISGTRITPACAGKRASSASFSEQ